MSLQTPKVVRMIREGVLRSEIGLCAGGIQRALLPTTKKNTRPDVVRKGTDTGRYQSQDAFSSGFSGDCADSGGRRVVDAPQTWSRLL